MNTMMYELHFEGDYKFEAEFIVYNVFKISRGMKFSNRLVGWDLVGSTGVIKLPFLVTQDQDRELKRRLMEKGLRIIENNNPHVKRAVFRRHYKGLYFTSP